MSLLLPWGVLSLGMGSSARPGPKHVIRPSLGWNLWPNSLAGSGLGKKNRRFKEGLAQHKKASTGRAWATNPILRSLAGRISAPPAWARSWAGPLTRDRWVFSFFLGQFFSFFSLVLGSKVFFRFLVFLSFFFFFFLKILNFFKY
jgi:hypothetical protein